MAQSGPRKLDIEQIKDKLGIGEDKVYAVMGAFETPEELVKAGRKVREMGYTKLDAMTPFPVHGIDAAIGIPYSKLGWIVICFSLTGLSSALLLQWYTRHVDHERVAAAVSSFDELPRRASRHRRPVSADDRGGRSDVRCPTRLGTFEKCGRG
jgi:hypothetical protein